MKLSRSWTPSVDNLLCSEHFEEKCFRVFLCENSHKLKESSVSTITGVAGADRTDDTVSETGGESNFIETMTSSAIMQGIEETGETSGTSGTYLCEFTGLLVDTESCSTPCTTSNTYLCESTGQFLNVVPSISSSLNASSPNAAEKPDSTSAQQRQ